MTDPSKARFEQAVRDSFAAQQLMATIGAQLTRVTAGEVEIRVPFRRDLTQQHGFLHAGVVTSALDSACGYATLRLMEEGVGVLTVEFKTNLLAASSDKNDRIDFSPGENKTVHSSLRMRPGLLESRSAIFRVDGSRRSSASLRFASGSGESARSRLSSSVARARGAAIFLCLAFCLPTTRWDRWRFVRCSSFRPS